MFRQRLESAQALQVSTLQTLIFLACLATPISVELWTDYYTCHLSFSLRRNFCYLGNLSRVVKHGKS